MHDICNKTQLLEDHNYWFITQWLTYSVIYLSLRRGIFFINVISKHIFLNVSEPKCMGFFIYLFFVDFFFWFLRNICMADLSFLIRCVKLDQILNNLQYDKFYSKKSMCNTNFKKKTVTETILNTRKICYLIIK